MMHKQRKSDRPVLPRKPSNKTAVRLRRGWREGAWPRETWEGKTGPGLSAGSACQVRLPAYVKLQEGIRKRSSPRSSITSRWKAFGRHSWR